MRLLGTGCVISLLWGGLGYGQAPLPDSPLEGQQHLDLFGAAFAPIGDLDGDGVTDLAIGSPQANTASLADAGSVIVLAGRTSLGLYYGSQAGEQAGTSIAALGDVTGDLIPDFAVGAPAFIGTTGSSQGRIAIISGADLTEAGSFTLPETNGRFGTSMVAAGDRDGDGNTDLLVSAPFTGPLVPESGAVLLVSLSLPNPTLLHRFDGDEFREHSGWSLASLPDVNGDLIPDLAIGSPDHDGAGLDRGRVRVFSGDPATGYALITEIVGQDDQEQMGWALSTLLDPTRSPGSVLLVGIPGRPRGSLQDAGGAALHCPLSGTELAVYQGDLPLSKLGFSLAAIADQDGDGRQDFLVGTPFASPPASFFAGVADLVSSQDGGTGQLTRLYRQFGGAGDRLGQSLGSIGDQDGDGCVDYGLGATGYGVPGALRGALLLRRSNRPSLRTDSPTYQDLDTITLVTQGFAARLPILMAGTHLAGSGPFGISFAHPWTMVALPTTSEDGLSQLSGPLNVQGQQALLYLQAVHLDAGGKGGNLQFSELATIQIN